MHVPHRLTLIIASCAHLPTAPRVQIWRSAQLRRQPAAGRSVCFDSSTTWQDRNFSSSFFEKIARQQWHGCFTELYCSKMLCITFISCMRLCGLQRRVWTKVNRTRSMANKTGYGRSFTVRRCAARRGWLKKKVCRNFCCSLLSHSKSVSVHWSATPRLSPGWWHTRREERTAVTERQIKILN